MRKGSMGFALVAVLLCCGVASAAPVYQNIFDGQNEHCHGSSIVECANGDFLACWFQGSGERKADDVRILGARLKKGASEWSPVFAMADIPGFPDCNPVMYIDAEERLWLFWITVIGHGWENSLLQYRRADDYDGTGAPEWNWQGVILLDPGERFVTETEAIFKELGIGGHMWAEYAPHYGKMIVEAAKDLRKRQTGWMTRIRPLTLPSGRILLPLYSDGFNCGLVAISDDLGETWHASGPITGGAPIQPTIVRRKNGELVSYHRDSGNVPKRALISISKDDGETWSPAVDTDINNPGSSLEVIALNDGRWVMIHNDTEQGRHQFTARMSDDEGKTWKWSRVFEPSASADLSFGYPSVLQGKDGNIYMSYSVKLKEGGACIRFTTLDPEWILGK